MAGQETPPSKRVKTEHLDFPATQSTAARSSQSSFQDLPSQSKWKEEDDEHYDRAQVRWEFLGFVLLGQCSWDHFACKYVSLTGWSFCPWPGAARHSATDWLQSSCKGIDRSRQSWMVLQYNLASDIQSSKSLFAIQSRPGNSALQAGSKRGGPCTNLSGDFGDRPLKEKVYCTCQRRGHRKAGSGQKIFWGWKCAQCLQPHST